MPVVVEAEGWEDTGEELDDIFIGDADIWRWVLGAARARCRSGGGSNGCRGGSSSWGCVMGHAGALLMAGLWSGLALGLFLMDRSWKFCCSMLCMLGPAQAVAGAERGASRRRPPLRERAGSQHPRRPLL